MQNLQRQFWGTVMILLHFSCLFALLGAAIPLIFRVIWWLFGYLKITDLVVHGFFEKLMLILWPTSLMTLPVSDVPGFGTNLFFISLVINSILYGIIGSGIWLGLRKHIGFLVLILFVVITIWWLLLSIH